MTAPHSHVYSLEKHQTLTYVEKNYPVIESSPSPTRRHRNLDNSALEWSLAVGLT